MDAAGELEIDFHASAAYTRTAMIDDQQSGPTSRITIRDVAHAAGVRPSTVSKALNSGRGSADVRQRVQRAAADLGYRPNERARGLRRAQSRSIGLLLPDLANPVFLPLLRGAERVASERGYVVLIADGQRSDPAKAAALERFFDQGVDGVLLAGPVPPESLQRFVDHGVPVAPRAPSDDDGDDDDHASSDRAVDSGAGTGGGAAGTSRGTGTSAGNAVGRAGVSGWERAESAATRAMAQRLLELGHRQVTFVAPPQPRGAQGRMFRRGRFGTLFTELRAAGAQLAVVGVDPSLGFDQCRAEFTRLLPVSPSTALVCGEHLLVPPLLAALADASLRLPDDLSLVAYGDSDWARAYLPALSVIGADTYALGLALATALLDEIAGLAAGPQADVVIQYVERGSCGPAPGNPRRPSLPFTG